MVENLRARPCIGSRFFHNSLTQPLYIDWAMGIRKPKYHAYFTIVIFRGNGCGRHLGSYGSESLKLYREVAPLGQPFG